MGDASEHRKYSPSQAERFFACHGSNRMLAGVARFESEYAIEGTKAHEVLHVGLKNNVRRAMEAHLEHSVYFAEDLNKKDTYFYFAIQVALNYVYELLDAHPDAVMWLETFVDPPLPSAPGEGGGMCDIAIYIPSLATLYVIDYKHGAGVAKDVKGNKQLLQYTAGFLYGSPRPDGMEDVSKLVLTIIQPRAFHKDGYVREWDCTPYEVYEYLQELDEVVAKCEEENAPLRAGDEQCRFCDAKFTCPARETQALSVVNTQFRTVHDVRAPLIPNVQSLDMTRISAILFQKNQLKKFLEDVEKYALELMRQGHKIPGKKLVEAQPRRRWYGGETHVAFKLAELTGEPVTDFFDVELISITDAEKLVVEAFRSRAPKGRGEKTKAATDARQTFAFLTIKESSGNLVIADETDERPEVNRASASFTQIEGLINPTQEIEE